MRLSAICVQGEKPWNDFLADGGEHEVAGDFTRVLWGFERYRLRMEGERKKNLKETLGDKAYDGRSAPLNAAKGAIKDERTVISCH